MDNLSKTIFNNHHSQYIFGNNYLFKLFMQKSSQYVIREMLDKDKLTWQWAIAQESR